MTAGFCPIAERYERRGQRSVRSWTALLLRVGVNLPVGENFASLMCLACEVQLTSTKDMAANALGTVEEEQGLVERISQGDAEAFRILFERYRVIVYRFCQLMMGKQETTEDIYQETFVAFYEACCRGERFRNVRGYLITVARNRCLNQLREKNRDVPLDDHSELQYEFRPELSDISEFLQKALLRIPEQYRESFILFEIEGYSYNEIAQYSGVERSVVKNRIYRAKQSLKKILAPILHDNVR